MNAGAGMPAQTGTNTARWSQPLILSLMGLTADGFCLSAWKQPTVKAATTPRLRVSSTAMAGAPSAFARASASLRQVPLRE